MKTGFGNNLFTADNIWNYIIDPSQLIFLERETKNYKELFSFEVIDG